MPYDPSQKVRLRLEAELGGVLVDITSRTKAMVEITEGYTEGADESEGSSLETTLINNDGWLTEDDPLSPWYGQFGRGTRLVLSMLDVLASPVVLFDGEIDSMQAEYPGASNARMRVVAVGVLGQQDQSDDPLRSPMFRSMIGVAPDDYVPYAYWPMIDGANATQFGSALPNGRAMPIAGTVAPASDDTLTGSESLPVFSSGASVTAVVPDYTDTSQWNVQFVMKVPTEPVGTVVLAEIRAAGTAAIWYIELVPGSPSAIQIRVTTFDGTAINSASSSVTESTFYDEWFLVTVRWLGDGAMVILDPDASFPPYAFPSFELVGSPADQIRSITLKGGVDQVRYGHLAVYTDPNFGSTQSSHNAEALDGFAGESAGRRMERLCREESMTFTSVGDLDDTAAMGPQTSATLPALLRECEFADQGLIKDAATGGALVYRTRASMYNQTAAVSITKGALTTSTSPRWDHRYIRNDITSSRPGGSSARAVDEAHVARFRRRITASPQPNLATDGQLAHDASWRLAKGTAAGPRFGTIGVNLRNTDGALLADALLNLRLGDRFQAAESAFSAAAPPGGVDVIVIGRTRELDADHWVERLNVLPASPYDVGVYGSAATVSRYDSANSTLTSDITSSATSVSVDSGGDTWVTGSSPADSPTFPLDVKIGGLVYECTAISGSSPTYTFTITRLATDKAHAAGTPVHVHPQARYAL